MKPVSTYHVGNSQIYGKTKNVSGTQLKKSETVMVLQNNVAWWFWVFWVWRECDHFLLLWLHRSILLKTHPPALKMITGEEGQKSSDNPGRDNQQAHIRVIAYFNMTSSYMRKKKKSGKRQRLQNHRMMTGQETKNAYKICGWVDFFAHASLSGHDTLLHEKFLLQSSLITCLITEMQIIFLMKGWVEILPIH